MKRDRYTDIVAQVDELAAAAGINPTVEVESPLDEVEAFLACFVSYPSEAARVAHVLWIGHAHLMDCWESTPRIAFLSPEPGSGKSRALEASELLVPLPVQAVNVTPAYLFRKVGSKDGRPTVLYARSTPSSDRRPKRTRKFAACSTPGTGAVAWQAVASCAESRSSPRRYRLTARWPWLAWVDCQTPSFRVA